jgi:energy-coupling factor transporter ATP-binding protein EcfA2
LALIGPGGAGKSSLLKAVAGKGNTKCCNLVSGDITLDDEPISTLGSEIGWYDQWHNEEDLPSASRATRLSDSEKKALSKKRLDQLETFAGTRRRLYVMDEPTALMTDEDAQKARLIISSLSADAFVLLATHNRQDCVALDGHMAIMAGGSIREAGAVRQVISNPISKDARRYLESGYLPSQPYAPPNSPSEGVWSVVPGLLCGLSRPGLVFPVERQYRLLAETGIRHLVCLEEVDPDPDDDCSAFGIARHVVPMPDMHPPTFDQAVAFCQLAEKAIASNQGIAFHCKGGLGRTGTAIAAVLIWHGDSAHDAINKVRRAQRLAIQSRPQMDFLHAFADRLRVGPTPAEYRRS